MIQEQVLAVVRFSFANIAPRTKSPTTNRANGIELAPATRTYAPRKNRAPVVKLGKNGNIVVGGRHSAVAGFEPGSKVKVESEPGRIIIVALADEDSDVDDTDDSMDL